MLTVIAQTRQSAARLLVRATEPVPAYSVAVFRILFGLFGFYGIVRFVAKGWVGTLYLEPSNHLTYQHYQWVQPWSAPWMYFHMAVVGVAALALAVGFRSRLAAAVYFVGFGYLELIDSALYLNHYWWVTLAAAWMVVLPVHQIWSIDSWRNNRAADQLNTGQLKADQMGTVPAVVVWILRAQLGVVYVFAGIAKLNPDWLMDGNPLGIWLANRSALPLVGALLAHPGAGIVASWAGMLFDCSIVGWLLWPRSRPFGYAAVVVFHSVTGLLFQIGLFPWLMIAGTLVFFAPDWPSRLWQRIMPRRIVSLRIVSREPNPQGWQQLKKVDQPMALPMRFALPLLVVLVVQLAVPLRHLASAGNVRWTEEGYYLSWRVMLTEKTGVLHFEVTDPASGEVWRVNPESVLADWQARQASIRSDLLLAAAHLVREDFRSRGYENVEVRAVSFVAINGRQRQRYVDESVDLAKLERGSPTDSWILPMEDPQYD